MDPDSSHSSSLPTPEPANAGDVANAVDEGLKVPIGPPPGSDHPTQAAPAGDPGATPQAASDSDRIEQEWVLKTKQLLLATHNDPYEQARQLAALRADYMRKRYNKEIKLGE